MKIKLILVSALLFGCYLIVSLSRDLWHLWQKEDEIKNSQQRLEELQRENALLGRRFQEVQSPFFVEKEAREKLGMAKEGETVLILPEDLSKIKDSQTSSEKEQPDLPNWQKWLKLFF